MDNKNYLPRGIFIDHEYNSDIERTRRLLLPIIRAARLNDTYKGYCKLEADKLVIRGCSYTLNNLHQLPDDLNSFKVTSRENEHCVGFFSGLNPLSNFHLATFSVDGVEYISSEQYIQAKKAEYFHD